MFGRLKKQLKSIIKWGEFFLGLLALDFFILIKKIAGKRILMEKKVIYD